MISAQRARGPRPGVVLLIVSRRGPADRGAHVPNRDRSRLIICASVFIVYLYLAGCVRVGGGGLLSGGSRERGPGEAWALGRRFLVPFFAGIQLGRVLVLVLVVCCINFTLLQYYI